MRLSVALCDPSQPSVSVSPTLTSRHRAGTYERLPRNRGSVCLRTTRAHIFLSFASARQNIAEVLSAGRADDMRDSEYFDCIERLVGLLYETVEQTCRSRVAVTAGRGRSVGSSRQASGDDGRDELEELALRLLRAAAVDFITPLGRRDISDAVLSVCRAQRLACELDRSVFSGAPGGAVAESCLRLASAARDYSRRLRSLRRRGGMPSAADYFAAASIKTKTPVSSGVRGTPTARERGDGRAGHTGLPGLLDAIMLHESLCSVCEKLMGCAYNNI